MRAVFYSLCIWLLVAAGAFLAGTGVLDYLESRGAQHEIADGWVAQEGPGDPQPASPSLPVPPGTALAKLLIPRLNTELYVVEGANAAELRRGPGHLTGTVMPGDPGNCVIAGHRDTHFRILKDIQKGDEIVLEREGRNFHYRVDNVSVVTPDNTASLRPTADAVLNLITCYPFYYLGSAPKRFIVHADLIHDAGS